MRKKELKSVFPILAVENDAIVNKHGEITVCFHVTLPEVYTMNITVDEHGKESGDYSEMVEAWTKAIGLLPNYSILHKQDWFIEEKYEASTKAENYLDRASELHFNERPFMNHQCFLYLTKTHSSRKEANYLNNSLTRSLVPKEILSKSEMDAFFSVCSQFQTVLEATGRIKLRRLTNDEIQPINGSKAGIFEKYMACTLQEENVSLMDAEVLDDCIKIGSNFCKYFTISDIDDMPEKVYTNSKVAALSTENSNISVGFAAPVGLFLNYNHIYNQYVFIDEKAKILQDLEKKSGNMKALANFGRANELNAIAIDGFLNFAAMNDLTPVRLHANIQVWTEDKHKLLLIKNETTAAIAKMNLRPRENSRDALFLFWAGMPGNAGDLPIEDTFQQFVPQGVCLFNMETNYHDTEFNEAGVKVTDRLTGKPLWVDFSDAPMKRGWVTNRNKFIIGPSGSGKSFLVNHLLNSYYKHGSHIVLIDVGHSYQGLCEMLGGVYLTYTDEKPINFNPFYIEGRQKPDIEKDEAIKTLILTLWKKSHEIESMTEYNAISYAIKGYYNHLESDHSIFPCLNTFFEYLDTDFKIEMKTLKIKDSYFDIDNLLFCLLPFYKGGTYESLLNSTENLDLINERFIVFELDNIKDHPILFPVVTIIIMDTFIAKMRKLKGIRKIILIEEAWKAIMKDGMADYIKYLYKTVRKFTGEAWIVTQEIDDIIGSKIIKDAIINNADTKILMDQRKYTNKFKHVKELLSLSDKEKDACLSLNRNNDPSRKYKEFFVSFAGQSFQCYGLEVSRAEYYAYTTEEKEKVRVQRKASQNGGNLMLALQEVVQEEMEGSNN